MKKKRIILSLTFILTLGLLTVKSQTRAVTDDGDTIYVYNNGTWSFELLEGMPEQVNEFAYLSSKLSIDTIATEFKVPENAKKQVENDIGQFFIRYDDKLWKRVPPATLNEDAEFAFQSKLSDIWCVVISEETPIESDKLFRIAKKMMEENTGEEPKIIKTELRKVNGEQLLRGVMNANFSGISFIFDTYYFSNDLGSVQFTTWTSDKVWEKNESSILELLNGFIVE